MSNPAHNEIFKFINRKVDIKCKKETFENVKIIEILRNTSTLKPAVIYVRLEDGRKGAINYEDVRNFFEAIPNNIEPVLNPEMIREELSS